VFFVEGFPPQVEVVAVVVVVVVIVMGW